MAEDEKSKNALIINVSDEITEESIMDVYCHCISYFIETSHLEVDSINKFKNALRGKKVDYLFLAGHGDEEYYTNNDSFECKWAKIGHLICKAECLNENSIIMLYCCQGGMVNVAYTLFAECPNIRYVIGAKQSMDAIQLTVGFNVFMYHVEYRETDPVLAARKATDATDIRFECFDRIDAEINPHWHNNYCKDCNDRNQSPEAC